MGKFENDTELIRDYLSGDSKAFGVIYRQYNRRVFAKIFMIVRNQTVAEDLTQDTFMKVVGTFRKKGYNEEGKFFPWLMRIAHNKAIDHCRKVKRYPELLPDEGDDFFRLCDTSEESYETKQIQADSRRRVRELVDMLPEAQREVVKMRNFMGMSYQEIADETGVSINTALGRMRYALNNLRKNINYGEASYFNVAAS
ncbi:RNA polymerase subunit sigma-24 [Fulvitalea axinellae]|uniref:RNA polymerase subunit sigma-24 n=1 Tax=Fulvitalea axinellae TaxID=1182444 RepID=A0AAU9CUN2_9BACT|nr:RNA polymerase subunit sigma-24 [Fulvitalea axinellae]